MNGMFSMCSELTFCVNQRVNRLIIYVVSTFFFFSFFVYTKFLMESTAQSLRSTQRVLKCATNAIWNKKKRFFAMFMNSNQVLSKIKHRLVLHNCLFEGFNWETQTNITLVFIFSSSSNSSRRCVSFQNFPEKPNFVEFVLRFWRN